jgi:hypothetical protein
VSDLFIRTSVTPPSYVGTDFSVRLYCWQHNAVHTLPLADVERLVYALAVAERDSSRLGADDPELGRASAKMPAACPLVVVRDWAGDPDLYAEWVEQGVGCREAVEVQP